MISNEEYNEFLNTIDWSIKQVISQDTLDDSRDNINYIANAFFTQRYGRESKGIVWVKQGNTPITEFYPSELMLPWLVTYLKYYKNFIEEGNLEEDLKNINTTCTYLAFVMTKVKGINIVDDTIYLLENDLEFVRYKIDQKLFI
jgi:hypothetical protein|tara:strand:- start:150 stop:581 length:432 start_codon:yes stop_codon:yes gene_type:complete